MFIGACTLVQQLVYEAIPQAVSLANASTSFFLYAPSINPCIPAGSGFASGWVSTYFTISAQSLASSSGLYSWSASAGFAAVSSPPAGLALSRLSLDNSECFYYIPDSSAMALTISPPMPPPHPPPLPPAGLYPFPANVPFTFTNCGVQGAMGPTMAQCSSAYAGAPWLSFFSIAPQQGYQSWTVPVSGTYRIRAAGAQGGWNQRQNLPGGFGAIVQAHFNLSMGNTLIIVVGQTGGSDCYYGGGGGGGTFVALDSINSLLLAAGGGGGAPMDIAYMADNHGLLTHAGGYNNGGSPGGTNGGGGDWGGGAGGGGYSGAGSNGDGCGYIWGANQNGGQSFLANAHGGIGGGCGNSYCGPTPFGWPSDQGGFGGGGGAEWCCRGTSGGGGGYSGGAGRQSPGLSGGGGSYINVATGNNLATSDGTYQGVAGYTSLGQFNGMTLSGFFSGSAGYVTVTLLQ